MIENIYETQEKNRTFKYKESDESINPNELELFVIEAIKTRAIEVMTQDIFQNATLAFKECYIKLKGNNNKTIFPKTYLKVIKKLGLSVEYDLMIFEELVLNYIEDKSTVFAINISPTSLRNEKFLSRVKELLNEENKKIMFILSEQEYFSHTNRYNTIINSLKKSGVWIAIDRLGSLHTSFLYLRELDIDVIRFDSYYSNEAKLSQNRSIIEGFSKMAREKGVKSWMKNIESKEVLSLAKEANLDYFQGKFLSNLENLEKIK